MENNLNHKEKEIEEKSQEKLPWRTPEIIMLLADETEGGSTFSTGEDHFYIS